MKSSGWRGEGEVAYSPFASTSAVVEDGDNTVNLTLFSSVLPLVRGDAMKAKPGLIFPDYIFA